MMKNTHAKYFMLAPVHFLTILSFVLFFKDTTMNW